MLRIDEFSRVSNWDGVLSTEEQVRFNTFGFSIPLLEAAVYFEHVYISSPIQLVTSIRSFVLIEAATNSPIISGISCDSPVTLDFSFNSLLDIDYGTDF